MFQNCDGQYPIVGTLKEDFAVIDQRIQQYRASSFKEVCGLA
jgi:hypothetical protein